MKMKQYIVALLSTTIGHSASLFGQVCPDTFIGRECVEIDVLEHGIENPDSFTFLWDFGDGQKGKGAKVSHCYDTPGSYLASLSLVDKKTGAVYSGELELPVVVASDLTLGWNVDEVIMANKPFTPKAFVTGSGPEVISWRWLIDDQEAAETSAPELTIRAGVHKLGLEVVLDGGVELCKSAPITAIATSTFEHETRVLNDGVHKFARGVVSGNLIIAEADTLQMASVFFEPDQTQVSTGMMPVLDASAGVLKRFDDLHLLIGSFTHSNGFYFHNRQVALDRSNVIKQALVQRGINPARIKVATPEEYTTLINTCEYTNRCDFVDSSLNLRTDFKLVVLSPGSGTEDL